MMQIFEQMGEAALLAHEGQAQVANAVGKALGHVMGRLKDWLAAMPTNLPPVGPRG